MTTFDDRKDAFEKKHAHDEELAFKATARRNKLLGLWVAEQIGLTGEAAESYARDVVAADLDEAGDADVIRKVQADLKAKNVDVSEHRLAAKLAELLETARQQLTA
ncbi:DUF1476 domain-containing protein [Ferrovibrio sp.]|uniref:DUF1476 domain-containing protein n=1 Tax=Ferrovibrio sp. TaxID=1917215 RepID=UPI000CC89047|nr:DUF1476 domain-containing protein [Ferrovibrio sp.]PJI37550.1 MAG: hypothetical protein CTR53_19680 [Ferrovibrio sp.]